MSERERETHTHTQIERERERAIGVGTQWIRAHGIQSVVYFWDLRDCSSYVFLLPSLLNE